MINDARCDDSRAFASTLTPSIGDAAAAAAAAAASAAAAAAATTPCAATACL